MYYSTINQINCQYYYQLSKLLKNKHHRKGVFMHSYLSIRIKHICVNTLQSRHRVDKEVIQPQVPLGLPCYDFTPVMNHKVVTVPPKVRLATSFAAHSHGVTGGVYKARERIHRGILIRDY